jgi:Spy/CpxP family protein refolding chaperone
MKRIIALFAFILVATFANAQTAQTAPTPAAERAHVQAMRFQKQLTLTEEQTTKVEAIILAKINAIDAVEADANKTEEQKEAESAQIRSDKEKEILALLTPEQIIKYNEMKNRRQERLSNPPQE